MLDILSGVTRRFVCLGATCKGRSSSPALNSVLQRSLPAHLGLGIYSSGGYIPSAYNPSDDPTRGVALRESDIHFPAWWVDMENGNMQTFDDFLAEAQLLPEQLAGYPSLGCLFGEDECKDRKKSHKNFRKHVIGKIAKKRQKKHEPQDSSQHSDDHDPYPKTQLSSECIEALIPFGKEQFIFGSDTSWPPRQPGFIDLFSGKKGYAKCAAAFGAPWVLCVDIEDGAQCDLLDKQVRRRIEFLVRSGACLALTAAPICSSFSRAITPGVRSKQYPRGFPWVQGDMRVKIDQGNDHSRWLAFLFGIAASLNLAYWVENPDTSYIWYQPEWNKLRPLLAENVFRTDFCRHRTPWRKRARFLTNTILKGAKKLCLGNHKHIVLRGRSSKHRMSWTKVAEPYPRPLCRVLAKSICQMALGHEDVCFCGHKRIGEAKNPGPRRRCPDRKDPEELENVQLIRPQTVALGKFHWNKFQEWLRGHFDDSTIQCMWVAPGLLGSMMAAYGKFWYSEGGPLYAYRHMLVYAQRSFPSLKGKIQEAWNVVAKWEELEPVVHRRPVPYPLIQAMAFLCVRWKWIKMAATILITFHGCTRPGEVLCAKRGHLVLPQDLGDPNSSKCYLKICKPKPGRRGMGRTQHATIDDVLISSFLTRVYGNAKSGEPLYPGSPSAFRFRWNALLKALGVPQHIWDSLLLA